MDDKKPAAKPTAQKKPHRSRVDPVEDPLAATMDNLALNKTYGFHIVHPYLLKTTSILTSTRRAHSIIDVFVYSCHESYYQVLVGSDGHSISIRTRVADSFLSNERIQNELSVVDVQTDPAGHALAANGLEAHNSTLRDISRQHSTNDVIWSDPPQIIHLPVKVENTIAEKSINWEPGCYELVAEFGHWRQVPPQYAVMR